MEIGDGPANSESRDLGPSPLDREGNWSVTENAEVICIVRVLPNVFTVENEVLTERLLQTGMKFVAEAGGYWRESIGGAGEEASSGDPVLWPKDSVTATDAGKHEVFVEWRF